jgi:hypothetical protein
MSSFHTDSDGIGEQEAREERTAGIAAFYKIELNRKIIPMLLLSDDILAAVDVVLGIDRRVILVQELRSIANLIERTISKE